ncbi:MAG: hypothetical protein IKZ00_06310 [Bacteroidaceae bacterium]|nr:hypothetical protein [Bacteroidaceae bacterium]
MADIFTVGDLKRALVQVKRICNEYKFCDGCPFKGNLCRINDPYLWNIDDWKATHKPEDCRCYTVRTYDGQGGCLGTKEIDPCKGENCENWKPKEG